MRLYNSLTLKIEKSYNNFDVIRFFFVFLCSSVS